MHAGYHAIYHGVEYSVNVMLATIKKARYWGEKLLDKDFHSGVELALFVSAREVCCVQRPGEALATATTK